MKKTMKNTILIFISLISMSAPHFALAVNGFYCSGTEPFWNATISTEKITFKKGHETTINFKQVNPTPVGEKDLDDLRLYRTQSTKYADATFILQKQACRDGISDHEYHYQTIILLDQEVYHGCCMKK